MLDYTLTLDPGLGVAREVRVLPPDRGAHALWTIAVDIGTSDLVGRADGMDMTWVGASGLLRSRTLPRAAGEAVERFALHPRGDALASGDGLPPAAGGAAWSPDADCSATYRGRRVGGGDVAVPTVAVDYPPRPGVSADGFDPSPSGTAAGAGLEAATRSATRELVERDVALRAWWQPAYAHRFTPALDDDRDGSLRALLRAAAGIDLVFVALTVPERPTAVLCLAVDDDAGVVGAGVSLEPSTHLMNVKAAQEALQIRALLIDLASTRTWARPAPPVRDEEDRARFWADPAACAEVRAWLAEVRDGDPPRDRPAHALALSADATVVDLTPRLPAALRDMGWAVVKAFDPALQPLRMSDRPAWNVSPHVRDDGGRRVLPHPLI